MSLRPANRAATRPRLSLPPRGSSDAARGTQQLNCGHRFPFRKARLSPARRRRRPANRCPKRVIKWLICGEQKPTLSGGGIPPKAEGGTDKGLLQARVLNVFKVYSLENRAKGKTITGRKDVTYLTLPGDSNVQGGSASGTGIQKFKSNRVKTEANQGHNFKRKSQTSEVRKAFHSLLLTPDSITGQI